MRLFTFLFIICHTFCFSQTNNTRYIGLPSDSLQVRHSLTFINDSTVRLNTWSRACMYRPLICEFSYKRSDSIIDIFSRPDSANFNKQLIEYKLNQFTRNLHLKIEIRSDSAFMLIDNENNFIYLESKKFDVNIFYWAINGKIYSKKEMRKLNKDIKADDIVKMKIYRGLDAYRKFGSQYLEGVVSLETK